VELSSTATGANTQASDDEELSAVDPMESSETMDTEVRIVVRDHGPGFPGAALSQPPEPFRRPASSAPAGDHTDGVPGGAGLGLAIVQAIAAAHGGELRLENDPEGGARATLVLRGPGGRAALRSSRIDTLGGGA
jgi:signal transduction histidine kinase